MCDQKFCLLSTTPSNVNLMPILNAEVVVCIFAFKYEFGMKPYVYTSQPTAYGLKYNRTISTAGHLPIKHTLTLLVCCTGNIKHTTHAVFIVGNTKQLCRMLMKVQHAAGSRRHLSPCLQRDDDSLLLPV